MEVIVLAISVGVALLWGGVFALIKMVDLFERKHILGLGAYTTLVAGVVMGLVLFTVYDRQKEHRRELQKQMETVTKRLSELSERLVGQLEEKADLTASEFEIRAKLQTEQEQHRRTQEELATEVSNSDQLTGELDKERRARAQYQQDQNRKLDQRFSKEEERYKEIRELMQTSRSTLLNMQKQLASVRDDASSLKTQVTNMQSTQNSLLGKVNTSREVQDLNSQKVDALARNQAALYEDLSKTMAEVDSLYKWTRR